MPYVIVDCNNFFVSCERVFDARLVGRPTVVLSNNDGCVISRSQEAKEIGIKMGEPEFQCREKIRRHNVAVLSGNFSLYGDMSQRVMNTLAAFSDDMEIYSIDEAFLLVPPERRSGDHDAVTAEIQRRVQRWTGIPVSVGVAPTKTLAKIANGLAKTRPELQRAVRLDAGGDIDALLGSLPVEAVWGIGRRSGAALRSQGIRTALALKQAEIFRIRRLLGVTGLRTQMELAGTSCLELEGGATRKMVLCSRSFGRGVTRLDDLREAVALYVTRAAEKLRRQGSAAGMMQVFVRTNRHRDDLPQRSDARSATLPTASNFTPELVAIAHELVERMFLPGYAYSKAGVLFTDLCPENSVQMNLFESPDAVGEREKQRYLMRAVDGLNRRFGAGTVSMAGSGIERTWYSRQERRSPRYTTQWNELFTVGEAPAGQEKGTDVRGQDSRRVHHARPALEAGGSRGQRGRNEDVLNGNVDTRERRA
jgi:DNA polymerase V